MAQSHCSPDDAFDLLRRASQRLNVPVRELAAQIVANTAAGPVKARTGWREGAMSIPWAACR